jgi:glycosyltransferase involved in cell wall biosynthesis
MQSNIILSICIPTYNRANYLKSCLSAIVSQVTLDLPIEIIISDNCSTDNTQEIINIYSDHPKFRVFKQKENIGAIKNPLKLVKEYAKGQFCWIIGDDDYIINGGIKSVVSILQFYNHIDFIFVKIEGFQSEEEINKKAITEDVNFEVIQSFENLLQPKYSAVFLGEIMAGIFRREHWLKYDKIYENIDSDHLSTLEMTYPHCVIFANQFMGKKAIYISTPIVIVDNRAREWWDKVGYVIIEHLFSLLQLYKKNGVKGYIIRSCKRHYINMSMAYFLQFLFKKNESYSDRINYKRYFLLLLSYPFTTIKVIALLIVDRYFSLSKK